MSYSGPVYDACAAFCDALAASGVRHGVICPGARSMPLALTADATAGLRTWVRVDERSAAFFGLGLAKATGRPTLLVCTSGTAAANCLPAVVEAYYSHVPLVVATADRPPELIDWGAGQTVQQHSMYGPHVRWFAQAPVPSELDSVFAQRWFALLGARCAERALGMSPGPVHVNVPFREPLAPQRPDDGAATTSGTGVDERRLRTGSDRETGRDDDDLDGQLDELHGAGAPQLLGGATAEADGAVSTSTPMSGAAAPGSGSAVSGSAAPGSGSAVSGAAAAAVARVAAGHERGVVVAGPMSDGALHADAVAAFCTATGWPLLAEPCSQLRRLTDGVAVISHYDLLLRGDWADELRPTAVLRIGGAPTCKPLRLWLERHRPVHLLIDPGGDWADASFTVTGHLTASPAVLAESAVAVLAARSGAAHDRSDEATGAATAVPRAWAERWADADEAARAALDRVLSDSAETLTEAAVARTLGTHLPAGHTLYVSNSMPVRDADAFCVARAEPLVVQANRGASGIDGVISSAAGCAAAGQPTTLVIGDLAFRHDIGGFVCLADHLADHLADRSADGLGETEVFDLTVVLLDNGGGTIFSFLPVYEAVAPEVFAKVFTAPPTGGTLALAASLAATLGFEHRQARSVADLRALCASPTPTTSRVRVISVAVNAETNRDEHQRVAHAVRERLAHVS